MFSFPVSMQAPADNKAPESITMDLIGEVLDGVVDLAQKLTHRQRTSSLLSEFERLALARNPQTPAEWLQALTMDASPLVRNELLFNPALPMIAKQRLAKDSDRFIASQAKALLSDAA